MPSSQPCPTIYRHTKSLSKSEGPIAKTSGIEHDYISKDPSNEIENELYDLQESLITKEGPQAQEVTSAAKSKQRRCNSDDRVY